MSDENKKSFNMFEVDLAAVEYAMSRALFKGTWLKLDEIRQVLLGKIKELSKHET